MELSRREMLRLALGAPLAAACSRLPPVRPSGSLVGTSHRLGHRVREPGSLPRATGPEQTCPIAIVGAGVAGLSAGWHLVRQGLVPGRDFRVFELESQTGGTARGGVNHVNSHPWGAHYLPVPHASNKPLVALLDEMGMLEGTDAQGQPIGAEAHVARDPQERLFYRGHWYEGLYLHAGATAEDVRQRLAFEKHIEAWVGFVDAKGRRAFTVPVAHCSDDAICTALDRITAKQWFAEAKLTSPRLLWWADYACRDDYGTSLSETSAWAFLFYCAARVPTPGAPAPPFLTWAEGNGRLVQHLTRAQKAAVQTDTLVTELVPTTAGIEMTTLTDGGQRAERWRCAQVIFAAPGYMAKHVLRPYRDAPPAHLGAFEHGAWVVSNLTLRAAPQEHGFPMAWENVLYDSPSLGYVASHHQQDRRPGRCVLTYYHAVSDQSGAQARAALLHLSQPEWADIAMADLRRAHPDLPRLVTQLDVLIWGHAMVRPRPGLIWGPERQAAQTPYRNIHFAHSELSGMALFEEAFYHGLRAADAVLARHQLAQAR